MSDVADISSERRDRAVGAADWRPRDALLSALADIDAGKIRPSHLIVAYYDQDETGFYQGGTASNVTATGILHRVIDLLWKKVR